MRRMGRDGSAGDRRRGKAGEQRAVRRDGAAARRDVPHLRAGGRMELRARRTACQVQGALLCHVRELPERRGAVRIARPDLGIGRWRRVDGAACPSAAAAGEVFRPGPLCGRFHRGRRQAVRLCLRRRVSGGPAARAEHAAAQGRLRLEVRVDVRHRRRADVDRTDADSLLDHPPLPDAFGEMDRHGAAVLSVDGDARRPVLVEEGADRHEASRLVLADAEAGHGEPSVPRGRRRVASVPPDGARQHLDVREPERRRELDGAGPDVVRPRQLDVRVRLVAGRPDVRRGQSRRRPRADAARAHDVAERRRVPRLVPDSRHARQAPLRGPLQGRPLRLSGGGRGGWFPVRGLFREQGGD